MNSNPDVSKYLEGKSKDELIEMVLSMTSSNSVGFDGFEKGELIDTETKYTKVSFDGYTFIPEELVAIGYDSTIECELTPQAWKRVKASRQVVDNIVVRILDNTLCF